MTGRLYQIDSFPQRFPLHVLHQSWRQEGILNLKQFQCVRQADQVSTESKPANRFTSCVYWQQTASSSVSTAMRMLEHSNWGEKSFWITGKLFFFCWNTATGATSNSRCRAGKCQAHQPSSSADVRQIQTYSTCLTRLFKNGPMSLWYSLISLFPTDTSGNPKGNSLKEKTS